MIIYTVKSGDNVYNIAKRFGVPSSQIISDNNLQNPNLLTIGQNLIIPTSSGRHQVRQGESLYSLSRQYGIPISAIIAANPNIDDPDFLRVGQIIMIPNGEKLGTIDVNGYAFPNITATNLSNVLPYLTFISVFSYQVRPDGSLVPIPDSNIVDTANRSGVAPMMVITNIREGGSFDSDLAHTILINEETQNALWENIFKTLEEKKYYGLDIDFEYIYPSDREAYNEFLRKTSAALHERGYFLTTALAPKLSADQVGVLYEAHDYYVHGQYADHVILMTYEWGYTYGPAQAVAPIDQVEKVLQYAVTVIPSKKILMGMPNYGYDWTLPFVRGSAARAISNQDAINLAQNVKAEIQYDEKAQSPFFNYYDKNGAQHVVYFDDARSIQARLLLVSKYNLGGVSYWNVNRFFKQNWLVLSSMYDINKVI